MTRARTRKLVCVLLAAAVGATLAASPMDMANASTRDVAECTGTTTLTFTTHNLTILGGPDAFTFLGGGMCTGLVSGPGSWSGGGTLQVTASCTEVLVISGSGTMTGPNATGPVAVEAVGPSVAQAWAFIGTNVGQIVATATFAWLNQAEIDDCLGPSGTATMSLMSVVAMGTT
jgi:hypothetical protein